MRRDCLMKLLQTGKLCIILPILCALKANTAQGDEALYRDGVRVFGVSTAQWQLVVSLGPRYPFNYFYTVWAGFFMFLRIHL